MFDLDGTVLDTLPDLTLSANYALKSLGFSRTDYRTGAYGYRTRYTQSS